MINHQCHISYEAREVRASGPLQLRDPNMKVGIKYSYSLPTHYDCYPTFNPICRRCVQVQQEKNTLQTLVTS